MSKGIGDAVIRPLKNALDGAPIHLRQLKAVVEKAGKKQGRNKSGTESIDRMDLDVEIKAFKRNRKHDSAEFIRQRDEQLEALQNISLEDWVNNRLEYGANGRSTDSLRAQAIARDDALRAETLRLRLEEGMSASQARETAAEWMQAQAATHRLDGIAGGNQTDISGVGDSRVNSSLGSQWRSRVGDLDRAVTTFIQNNPGVDLSTVRFNLSFR